MGVWIEGLGAEQVVVPGSEREDWRVRWDAAGAEARGRCLLAKHWTAVHFSRTRSESVPPDFLEDYAR